jgi:hypothetical protein
MATVSGIVRDAQGNPAPGLAITARYKRQLVGYDGGAVYQDNRVFTTDETGLLVMEDLVPGYYDLLVIVPLEPQKIAFMTVLDVEAMTLQEAMGTDVADITPTIAQQAIAAKDAAEAAADEADASATLADAARIAAEAARDSSFANAKGADTIANARALVADTETFIVYAAGAETFDAYRRLTSTTEVFLGTYPSAAAEQRGRRVTAMTRRPREDLMGLASLAARITALENRTASIGTIVYADPTATGANDGSSWANAFTSLAAAVAATPAGGRLWTNSTEAAPFGPTSISVAASNITWETDRGPAGETWISGANRGAWTDEGGGVFSIALATAPTAVAYDYKRDDVAGTVTGVDLTEARIAREIRRRGVDPARLVAWYGALRPSSPLATTTPAEGFYGHTSGRLYVNPPGTPTLSHVNDLTIWGTGANLFAVTAAVSGWTIQGRMTTFFSPSPAPASGYGLRFTNAREMSVDGVLSIMSGYHSIGFVNSSGARNVIRNCHTTGYSPEGIPYVYYTSAQDLPRAGHHLDRACVMSWHLMDGSGVPISLTHRSQSSYSHTDGVRVMSGIEYSDLLQVCFAGQIEAKHSITLTLTPGFVSAANTGDVWDQDNEASFGVKARGCVVLGHGGRLPPNISYIGCTWDRMGYGDDLTDLFALSTVGWGTGAWNIRLTDCILRPGLHRYVWSLFAANDTAWLDGCAVTLDTSAPPTHTLFQITEIGTANRLRFRNCTFDVQAAGRGIFTYNNTVFAGDPYGPIQSLGGNIYSDRVTVPIRHTNGTSTIGIAAFMAAMDPNGRDVSGLSAST